jgi:phytoene dehydrogenase-like protein
MTDPRDIPQLFLDTISRVPYTSSELCVYLGVDPRRVDLSQIKAPHLFYRYREDPERGHPSSIDDFENREFEVCLWSANAPGLVPDGKESLVLRVGLPHDHFAAFRTGEKRRREDYQPYKTHLAQNLIKAAEHILPGLRSSIEVIESATPLTYEDWGHRHSGSIAGWTWSAEYERALGRKLLIETPVEHLLMAGIYAASELFLGGIPTALQTARLAADLVLS